MNFVKLPKLKKGDKVAIVSPSFAAPGQWPHVYEYALKRVKDVFGLEPVEFSVTKKLGATVEERSKDLIDAFENKEIKAVIASLGGDDQVTYVKNLPKKPFIDNPKPFFGYSDNTHFINHLWLCGVPAYYGGSLFTEFGMQGQMDDLTVKFLERAFFESGLFELESSPVFNDIGLDWSDPLTLNQKRRYQDNDGWQWNGGKSDEGITWGGCLESIDEMLRCGVRIPSLIEFGKIVLLLETCEEIPASVYVSRVLRALGERGILERVKGLLVGRPKAWEFDKQRSDEEKIVYKNEQRSVILKTFRKYNKQAPVVQNLDFGHTAPQICLPAGAKIVIDSTERKIRAEF